MGFSSRLRSTFARVQDLQAIFVILSTLKQGSRTLYAEPTAVILCVMTGWLCLSTNHREVRLTDTDVTGAQDSIVLSRGKQHMTKEQKAS